MPRYLSSVVLIVLLLTNSLAFADGATNVEQLLGERRFPEADKLSRRELQLAQRTGSNAKRLEALNHLLDSAILQHRLTDDLTGKWIDQALDLTESLRETAAGQRAKLLAAKASRELLLGADEASLKSAHEYSARSIELAERQRGTPNIADSAYVFTVSADILIDEGNLSGAEVALSRSEEILSHAKNLYEKSLYTLVLGRLGSLRNQLNRTPGSLDKGLDFATKTFGKDSALHAIVATNLGIAQVFADDCLAARQTLQTAVDILKISNDELYARTYASIFLANALSCLGSNDETAKAILRESISLSTGDAKHFLPSELNSLALLERRDGHIKDATQLFAQSIALNEARFGKNSPRLGSALFNLAQLQRRQGELVEAQQTLERASNVASQSATFKSGVTRLLGEIALARGNSAEASTAFAQSIRERTALAIDHDPFVIGTQCLQAIAVARLGKYDEAYVLARDSERARVVLLQKVLPSLSGDEGVKFKANWDGCVGPLMALSAHLGNSQAVLEAWELLSSSRELGSRLEAARLASVRTATAPSTKEKWQRWQATAQTYSTLLLKDGARQSAVHKAQEDFQAAEDALQSEIPASFLDRKNKHIGELLARLPRSTSLVAYVTTDKVDLSADAKTVKDTHRVTYAFVQDRDSSRLVLLGDAQEIDAQIKQWYELLRNPASSLSELNQRGANLRRTIWDGLFAHNGAKQVFVVPSGELFHVNFSALPDDQDRFLVEDGWRIHLLDNEADLSETTSSKRNASSQFLLVGAPDFGVKPSASDMPDECAASFSQLPGLTSEIERLAHLWQVAVHSAPLVLRGNDVSKEDIRRNAPTSDMVHISTHAVDFGECAKSVASRGMSLGGSAPARPPMNGGVLALSGANNYFTDGITQGLLTGEEIATMDFGRAQWIVLAACDTGAGTITLDEGIFGLRRAFRLAGAKTLIVSLWSIDDATTEEWMEQLYKARLVDHKDTPDAISYAEMHVLAERRASGKSVHPFYWAPFVASGDWH